MKKIIIFLFLFKNTSYSQQLTIEETFKYIENIENVYTGYMLNIPERIKINTKYPNSKEQDIIV